MGRSTKFPRHLVETAIEKLVSACGSNVVVCGSYRRGCDQIGDIDLVNVSGAPIEELLLSAGCRVVERGSPRTEYCIDVSWCKRPLKVDVWEPVDGRIGACILHATGSGIHNTLMRRFGFSRGFKITWAGVERLSDGQIIAGLTEKECFDAIGWPHREPANREEIDWALALVEHLNDPE